MVVKLINAVEISGSLSVLFELIVDLKSVPDNIQCMKNLPASLSAAILMLLFVGAATMFAGCTATEEEPYNVGELLEHPVYDTPVYVAGEVSDLGVMDCMCFHLISGGDTLEAWYGTMVEDDRTAWPDVEITGIENGDEVVLYGELKSAGKYRQEGVFWIKQIEKIET